MAYLPTSTFNKGPPPTRIALTTIVIIPISPITRRTLSARTILRLRNYFVTYSPKRARRGAKSVNKLFEKSSPSNAPSIGAIIAMIQIAIRDSYYHNGVRARVMQWHEVQRL